MVFRFVRSIATVSSYTVISRILGFIRDVLIARFLGTSFITDAFFVSFKLPNLFRRLFAEGAFNAAFVPIFSKTLEKKRLKVAKEYAEQIFSVLFFTLIALLIFVELNLNWIMKIIVPGFIATPKRMELAIYFTHITFPFLLFISLSALLSGILNSLGKFAAAAFAPILLNICMIIALYFFSETGETPAHSLAWAVLLAGITQFILLYFFTKKANVKIKLRIPKLTPQVRRLLRIMIPGAIGAGIMQLNLFIDMIIASLLPTGSVSFLFFADRLNQLPLSLIGVAIGIVLLPILSRQLQMNALNEAINTQNRCLEFGLLLVFPATIGLIMLSHPIISVLFERGEMQSWQIIEISKVLIAFVCGLPAYVMIKVFSTSFFARHDTKTPVYGALIAMVFNLVLNLILIIPFKHVGIAIATAISAWINMIFLTYKLIKKDFLVFDLQLLHFLPRVVIACLILVFSLYFGFSLTQDLFLGSEFSRILALSLLTIGGFFIYMISAHLVKAVNLMQLLNTIKGKTSCEK